MKTFIEKVKKNKVLNIVRKIVSFLATILLILVFSVIIVQKVSNNRVNLGGYGIYTVVTGSMIPEYNVKDLILASKVEAKNINIGDDVVYIGKEGTASGKIIAHRVIEKNENNGRITFITKGISNEIPDPEIDNTQILGVVKQKLYVLSFCSHIVNNIWGLILLVFIPLVIFIFMEGKRAIDKAYKE